MISFIKVDEFEKCADISSFSIDDLLLFHHYSTDPAKERLIEIVAQKVAQGEKPYNIFYQTECLIAWILNNEISCLYPWLEMHLEERINRINQLKESPLKQEKFEEVSRFKNHLFYIKREFNKISDNIPFYKAIKHLEKTSGVYDPLKANMLLAQICENDKSPNNIINYLYSFCLLINDASNPTIRGEYIDKSNRIILEANQFATKWGDKDREHYAIRRYFRMELIFGTVSIDYVKQLESELNVSLTEYLKEYNSVQAILPYSEISVSLNGVIEAFRKFDSFTLERKLSTLFKVQSINDYTEKQSKQAGIIKLILDTCLHLNTYTPQLLCDRELNENNYNQLFREMFNHAYGRLGVHCHDQEQTGFTGHIGKAGNRGISELDFALRFKGDLFSIGEALILESCDTANIDKHIGKLIGSNFQSHSPLFLLIYGRINDENAFWERYQEHLEKSALYKLCNIKNFQEIEIYKDELFANHTGCLKILYSEVSFGGNFIPLYHIFMDIQNQAYFDQAAKARK